MAAPGLFLSPAVTAETNIGVIRAARGADRALITEVGVFDVYAGEGIAEGQKSVAISVRLEPTRQTLTDAEIDAVAAKIIAQVSKATGATLRE